MLNLISLSIQTEWVIIINLTDALASNTLERGNGMTNLTDKQTNLMVAGIEHTIGTKNGSPVIKVYMGGNSPIYVDKYDVDAMSKDNLIMRSMIEKIERLDPLTMDYEAYVLEVQDLANTASSSYN